jgi:poly(A) polymerase/tRNA nucleotidyltransferase (CCA-adding enzyme)
MEQEIKTNLIPNYVTHVTKTLQNNGFEAFLVGGCVRDLILGRDVKDWDVTTNATPEQMQAIFEKTVYENTFGTVGVCIPVLHETSTTSPQPSPYQGEGAAQEQKPEYHIIEVTTYRKEANYTDFRHPEEVSFTGNINEDLERRDFTMNALALGVDGSIKDIFEGLKDIKDKIIRTVGNPDERFSEDALRMLRAIRFSTVLDFAIDGKTLTSIAKNADLIKHVSRERIRDEFIKIIASPKPAMGIALLQKLGLLKHIIPELEEGIGCNQGGAHIYDVFEHLLGAVQHAADKGYSTNVRLSALFHDIGKPRTKRPGKLKPTFYGHEVVGAKMTKKILEDLKLSRETITFVTNMVRRHMFFSDTEQITLSAVRRIVASVTPEHIWELMQVRECDRVGMKKAEAPYRLRKYHAMIDEVLRDPISVGQLKIDGNYMIEVLHMKPGRRMGWMLHALLEEVLEDPQKNTIEYLTERVKDLEELDDQTLKTLGDKAKDLKDELEDKEIETLRKNRGVK